MRNTESSLGPFPATAPPGDGPGAQLPAAALAPALAQMLNPPEAESVTPAQTQTMVVLSLSTVELTEYGRWTETVWLSDADGLKRHDYAMMGLGLASETGEVVDALNDCTSNGVPEKTLLKALGDAIFYCARIANAVELQIGPGFCPAVTLDPAFPDAWAVQPQLTISAGHVSRALNNLIRDGVQPESYRAFQCKLTQALNAYLQAWLVVVASAGFTPQKVLADNQTKIDGGAPHGALRV